MVPVPADYKSAIRQSVTLLRYSKPTRRAGDFVFDGNLASPLLTSARARGMRRLFGWLKMASLLLWGLVMMGCGKTPPPTPNAAMNVTTNRSVPAQSPTNAPSNELALPKSAFDPLSGGKDPFYPRTARLPKTTTTNDNSTATARPRLPLSSYLKLTGLWPSKTRPLALINKTILEPGERGPVTIVFTNTPTTSGVQTVQVTCVDIRKESVVIRIEGESGTTELKLPVAP